MSETVLWISAKGGNDVDLSYLMRTTFSYRFLLGPVPSLYSGCNRPTRRDQPE